MSQTAVKKSKINLSDYNYRRDIENRLLMAHLSTFEVEVLREILHSSLKFTIQSLTETLEAKEADVMKAVDKLIPTKLVNRKGDHVTVDKEMRKYYESQILKFDDDFEAGMEFLQGLLSKVPIHHLPNWYSISRTSDNIFLSIVEKFLLTPKIYEKYLQDLCFDDPTPQKILTEVLASPELKVPADKLIAKHGLSRERFEEYLLLLEFSCACCLCYSKVDDEWQEVVTPFTEWKEHLEFQRKNIPAPIIDSHNITLKHPEDFGFIQDMATTINALQKKPISLEKGKKGFSLPEKGAVISLGNTTEPYRRSLVDRILLFHLAELKNDTLHPLKEGASWAKLPFQEQALSLYKMPVEQFLPLGASPDQFAEKDLREIEKGLKRVQKSGWIYFEDFIKGFISPIGGAEPVELKNKGKKWRYVLPTYTPVEIALVENTLFDRLFCCGMVACGTHNGKACFTVTPFGRMTIGE